MLLCKKENSILIIKKNLVSYYLSSVCAELGNVDWIYNYARILFFKIAPSGYCGEWEVGEMREMREWGETKKQWRMTWTIDCGLMTMDY
ncbi:hypothetical protein NSMS1_28030 [Nostoc sp. MS1]|nr:hypothetical protein NSMS1_28030 [Nostoc sp. MS1]